MSRETVFRVRDLSAGYARPDGSVELVLDELSYELKRGEMLGLVGESGCGKSTAALTSIGYRAPGSRILSGEAWLGGDDLLALPARRLRAIWGSKVAYVAQNAALALNPALTVGRQLAQPLSIHLGLEGAAARGRSLALLDAMGLADPQSALRRYPFQFSGGQQQRIALAIALACNPDVLILDEPTTGLDVTTQARITALLRELIDNLGVGCLYVSHDLALLGTVADAIAVMYAGELVESGPAAAVVAKRRHPYTKALLAAVPSLQRPRLPVGIEGGPPSGVVTDRCAYAARCPYVLSACRSARVGERVFAHGHLARCLRAGEIDGEPLAPAVRTTESARGDVADAPPAVLLETARIRCDYSGSPVAAVKDVDLIVHEGERVGIVGESGSGKSTLLRAIVGLHRPTSGSIRFADVDLAPTAVQRPREIRRSIQLVFQNPDSSLNPRHTIQEIVARPIRLFRDDVKPGDEREAVRAHLDAVRLPSTLLHRYPVELSGGQRQRVALARAFAARPSLLLCDEVTSALDVSVQATVLTLVAELSERTQTAVIWVSHDLGVVRSIAGRALVMRDGQVCEEGTTGRLFSSARHPYTQQLLAAVPELPS